jgi:sigma-B regulation protein RsbU (phosphoserine phosphatase)
MADAGPLPAVGPGTSTIKQEFNLARQVMTSVMPRGFRDEAVGFDLRYRPMIGIGGDHAGVERFPDACRFTVSDVTGHGIAAALMVRDVCGFVQGQADARTRPGALVSALNRYLLRVFSDAGIFMTFFCGLIDLRRRELVSCGAGHPPLILCGPNRPRPLLLESRYPVLGIGALAGRREAETRTPLADGDRLLFYTDGLIETRNPAGEIYGLDRLVQEAARGIPRPSGDHLEDLLAAVDAFRGERPQQDDLLAAVLDVRHPDGSARRKRVRRA